MPKKKDEDLVKKSLYFKRSTWNRLQAYSSKFGIPASALMRMLLEDAVDRLDKGYILSEVEKR